MFCAYTIEINIVYRQNEKGKKPRFYLVNCNEIGKNKNRDHPNCDKKIGP
jgi:hypothetical protein